MANEKVETVKTNVTPDVYVAAALRALRTITGSWPSRDTIGVLWAHYAHETGGGASCYGFNLGNVKHVEGDGYDYHELQGVWEGVTPAAFALLQKSPLAHLVRLDPNEDHQRAIGQGRFPVIFDPPHPASRFRAYPSLAASMAEHFLFLKTKRYAGAWPAVEAGDVALFALRLHDKGYYTASVASYTAALARWFNLYQKSAVYGRAIGQIADAEDANTEPVLPAAVSSGEPLTEDEDVARQPILHSFVPFPSYRAEDDEDDNVMVRDLMSSPQIHAEGCGSRLGLACDCRGDSPPESA